MVVLSLFDGMSCGQIALKELGITVDEYYASEVDKFAIEQTKLNFPDTIQLGDVTSWRSWHIDWGSIDLLIGGSPCQGFSFAGRQLAFDDPRSKLFFEFVDILNHIRKFNPDVRFLLENVKMKKEFIAIINEYLGVAPVEINSSLVSAQNRVRLYWTNINNGRIPQPDDKGLFLRDIVEKEYSGRFVKDTERNLKHERSLVQKSLCCTATMYKGAGNNGMSLIREDGRLRCITTNEVARLQTVPEWYRWSCSKTQQYKMLGNGWTVEVVKHIFSYLNHKGYDV